MPVPLEQFVKQLEDSGILAGDTLQAFLPPKASPKDAEELARELVRQKKLTKFQAEEVYRGKAKSLVLGNYVLMEKIGAGGMGQVFKARHRRLDRLVAVKLLPPALMRDPDAIARFEREVKAAAKLRHPNLVAADDADQAHGVHFLVMELVEGSDLSALVKKTGRFSIEKAVNCILQAARGLEAAHRAGIVHRDIKPANLLLNTQGVVKILDMGLARLSVGTDSPHSADLTSTGAIMGTVDYMAPEQALDSKTADARADIYALGCSLFYLLAGKATYDGDSLMKKILAHREQPIPSLRAARPEVTEQLDGVFQKMVAKNVEERYQTVTAVIAALENCGARQGSSINALLPVESSTDTGLNFFKDISIAPSKPFQPIKPLTSNVPKKFLLIGGGVLGVLILLGALVITFGARDGTLTISVSEPDADVQLLNVEGKVEVNRKVGKEPVAIVASPGKHRLKVWKDGFDPFTSEFDIRAGGAESITAKLVPVKTVTPLAPVAAATDAPNTMDRDRTATNWVLANGGSVKVTVSGQDRTVSKIEDIPPDRFQILVVNLSNTHVNEAQLEHISSLKRVQWVNLLKTQVTDTGLRKLVDLPDLKQLWLLETQVTDAGLQHIRTMDGLEFLGLNGTNVTDAGVPEIAAMKNLSAMDLRNTKVTANGVATLRKALPNCRINWNDSAK